MLSQLARILMTSVGQFGALFTGKGGGVSQGSWAESAQDPCKT